MTISVYRHTQQTAAKIKDMAIISTNLDLSIQTATGTPPAAAAYVSFSTAFVGTPPWMWADYIGPYGGSGTVVATRLPRLDLTRVRTGSFQWTGSPTARARWRAVGFLNRSSA